MSASVAFVEYVRDLLMPIGALGDSKFFGGHAFKFHQIQFAMIMGNTLYLRVNNDMRQAFEDRGSKPFSYSTKRGTVLVRKYYAVPEDVLEDQQQLLVWAKQAISAN